MATTPRLPIKLYERLGHDAMTELLTLFGDLGAETRAEFQQLRGEIGQFRAEIGQLRAELQEIPGEFQGLREANAKQLAGLKQDLTEVKSELKQDIADVRGDIKGAVGELTKWTFLFWLGTIGIILLLIRFPV